MSVSPVRSLAVTIANPPTRRAPNRIDHREASRHPNRDHVENASRRFGRQGRNYCQGRPSCKPGDLPAAIFAHASRHDGVGLDAVRVLVKRMVLACNAHPLKLVKYNRRNDASATTYRASAPRRMSITRSMRAWTRASRTASRASFAQSCAPRAAGETSHLRSAHTRRGFARPSRSLGAAPSRASACRSFEGAPAAIAPLQIQSCGLGWLHMSELRRRSAAIASHRPDERAHRVLVVGASKALRSHCVGRTRRDLRRGQVLELRSRSVAIASDCQGTAMVSRRCSCVCQGVVLCRAFQPSSSGRASNVISAL